MLKGGISLGGYLQICQDTKELRKIKGLHRDLITKQPTHLLPLIRDTQKLLDGQEALGRRGLRGFGLEIQLRCAWGRGGREELLGVLTMGRYRWWWLESSSGWRTTTDNMQLCLPCTCGAPSKQRCRGLVADLLLDVADLQAASECPAGCQMRRDGRSTAAVPSVGGAGDARNKGHGWDVEWMDEDETNTDKHSPTLGTDRGGRNSAAGGRSRRPARPPMDGGGVPEVLQLRATAP
jgi:hypothetical protein